MALSHITIAANFKTLLDNAAHDSADLASVNAIKIPDGITPPDDFISYKQRLSTSVSDINGSIIGSTLEDTINSLIDLVNKHEDTISGHETRITTLENDVATLKSQIGGIQSDVASAKQDAADAKTTAANAETTANSNNQSDNKNTTPPQDTTATTTSSSTSDKGISQIEKDIKSDPSKFTGITADLAEQPKINPFGF